MIIIITLCLLSCCFCGVHDRDFCPEKRERVSQCDIKSNKITITKRFALRVGDNPAQFKMLQISSPITMHE